MQILLFLCRKPLFIFLSSLEVILKKQLFDKKKRKGIAIERDIYYKPKF